MTTNSDDHTASIVDDREHKVIMQITHGDRVEQLKSVGQLRNIKRSLPNARIEVVCHSNGIDMLTHAKSKVASHLDDLKSMNVVFAACQNTMEREKVSIDDLLPGVIIVPSAMAEIILKQEAGWSYLKGGS